MSGALCLGLLAGVLTACGSSSGGGRGGDGALYGDLTVQGRVLYITGGPAANIAVHLAGRGPFVTDANGEFTVTDAPVPYDAIVFHGADSQADVWQGLTRPDPTFTVTPATPGVFGTTDVDGTVTGGVGLPVPADHDTQVGFGVEDGFTFGTTSPDPNTGDYVESDLIWIGPLATTLHISALQHQEDADGHPINFTGYGTIQAPVSLGDDLMNQDIVMGPVGTTTISGTLAGSDAWTTRIYLVFAGLPGNGMIGFQPDFSVSDNFSLKAPVGPGLTRNLMIYALDPEGNVAFLTRSDLDAPTTNLIVTLPTPTGLVLPVEGAAGVGYQTQFRVTASPGDRVFSARFRPDSGPGPEIVLHTASSTFRIPDLSAHGMGLPAGEEYSWRVGVARPANSVDDLAVERTIAGGILPILGAFGYDGSTLTTAERNFFTAP